MKVIGLNLYRYDSPFVFEFKTSHAGRSKADAILIELLCDHGISGWGESVPRPYVTGETAETVLQIWAESIAPILFQADLVDLEDITNLLHLIENDCLKKKLFHFNSALGACDIALLDALSKSNRAPLTELLGPIVRDNIPYSVSVPLVPVSVICQAHEMLGGINWKHIKIIMNSDLNENYERVSCVRSLYGISADIRIEANGNWTVQQALANIENLSALGISAVEQPVAPNDLDGLREIRRKTGLPVVVDESLCCLKDAHRLVAAEACDLFNIKISKCGGLLRSKEIAAFADSQGIPCHLGSHVGETSILHQAGECFALTTRNIMFYEGCSPLLLGSDLTNPGQMKEAGRGLGLSIDREALQLVLSLHREGD